MDSDQALDAAIDLFWHKGLADTSLDDLSAAMSMTRPSIYNAFGDKERLYRQALARFCGQLDAALNETLLASADLRTGLERFFAAALRVYYSAQPARGCLMMCTAPAEALAHPEVRADLRNLLRRVDDVLEQRLKVAQQRGQFPPNDDCRAAAKLIQATLHSAALRARAGESRRSVQALTAYAIRKVTLPESP